MAPYQHNLLNYASVDSFCHFDLIRSKEFLHLFHLLLHVQLFAMQLVPLQQTPMTQIFKGEGGTCDFHLILYNTLYCTCSHVDSRKLYYLERIDSATYNCVFFFFTSNEAGFKDHHTQVSINCAYTIAR